MQIASGKSHISRLEKSISLFCLSHSSAIAAYQPCLHVFGANVVMRKHVVRARADIVATKLGIIGANVVHTHGFCARADIVATKLGIIGANVVHTHAWFPCEGRRSGH